MHVIGRERKKGARKLTQEIRKVGVEAGDDEAHEISVKIGQPGSGHVEKHDDLLARVAPVLKINKVGHEIFYNRHDCRITPVVLDAKYD